MRRSTHRTFLVAVVLALATGAAAPRWSWNKVRYVGGTIAVKSSPYDWNTKVTIDSTAVDIEIAPASVFQSKAAIRLKPSQIQSFGFGPRAWRRVAAVDGAKLPTKPPALFGLLSEFAFLSLVYSDADGKTGAVLLQSHYGPQMVFALEEITGKQMDDPP